MSKAAEGVHGSARDIPTRHEKPERAETIMSTKLRVEHVRHGGRSRRRAGAAFGWMKMLGGMLGLSALFLGAGCGGDESSAEADVASDSEAVSTTSPPSVDSMVEEACSRLVDLRQELINSQIGPRAATEELVAVDDLLQQAREERPADQALSSAAQVSELLVDGFDPDFGSGIWGDTAMQTAGQALSKDFCGA